MAVKIVIVLLAFCCIAGKTFCQEKDSIILYNGQILIGAVQGATLGIISIDDIDLKIMNIKLYKIRRLVIYERFKIEMINKKIYYGTMKTTSREGWVDIHTVDSSDITIHITDIYQLISLDNRFFTRLNGNVSAGLSFTKSSGIGQVNFSGLAQYSTRLVDYQLSVSSIGSIDSGRFSRDNENVQLFTSYDLNNTWFLAASAQYQRNLELSIARRWLGMTGAGNKLIIRENWRLMAVSGISFSLEKSTSDVSSSLLYEVPVMLVFNFYQFHHPDIQISSIQSAFISLSQKGRFRYQSNTTFSWQLIRYFYLNLSPYSSFDNQPPAGNGNTFDYGLVFGLSYKF